MRDRKGFTYVELLTVLAILAVVALTVMPYAASEQKRIRLKMLDDQAHALYMECQHKLYSLDSAGELGGIRSLSNATESETEYILFEQDSEALSDLTERKFGFKSAILEYYVNSPTVPIVRRVYYSDSMSPEQLEILYKNLGYKIDGDFRERYMIGYSGDDGVQEFPEPFPYRLIPKIKVINDEELYLEISSDDIPKDDENLSVSVNLYAVNPDGGRGSFIRNVSTERTVPGYDPEDMFDPDNKVLFRALIDSAQYGGTAFAELNPGYTGVKVEAEAVITYVKTDKSGGVIRKTSEEDAKKASVIFDPMFEDRDQAAFLVSKVRHLNNLRYLSGSINVALTSDIDFSDLVSPKFYRDTVSHSLSLTPISLKTGGFTGSFDGRGHIIKNIVLNPSGELFGLFTEIKSGSAVRNLHLSGSVILDAGDSKIAGAICGRLCSGATVENCSVSEIKIRAESPGTVGGIAGECLGEIKGCSAIFEELKAGIGSTVGAITGKLLGGTVFLSHSGGKIISGSGSELNGIAGGTDGIIRNCYSECSTGYINGSEFYALGSVTCKNSQAAAECSWISIGKEERLPRDDISVPGFDTAYRRYRNGEIYSGFAIPESVKTDYGPTRFGSDALPEPRGLIGIVKVRYDGGNGYEYELRESFDGYGNDSENFPRIEWYSPRDGEERYYIFRNAFSYPEGGEDGWEVITDGELSDEGTTDFYVYMRVTDTELVTLRFGDTARDVEIEEREEEEEVKEKGSFGLAAVMYDEWAGFDEYTFSPIPGYVFYYQYFDETGQIRLRDGGDSRDPADILPWLEEFSFNDPEDLQTKIFIFWTKTLECKKSWDIEELDIDGEIQYYFSGEGAEPYEDSTGVKYMVYELGDFSAYEDYGRFSATFNAPGWEKSRKLTVYARESPGEGIYIPQFEGSGP